MCLCITQVPLRAFYVERGEVLVKVLVPVAKWFPHQQKVHKILDRKRKLVLPSDVYSSPWFVEQVNKFSMELLSFPSYLNMCATFWFLLSCSSLSYVMSPWNLNLNSEVYRKPSISFLQTRFGRKCHIIVQNVWQSHERVTSSSLRETWNIVLIFIF
jgi:hypothetical protein